MIGHKLVVSLRTYDEPHGLLSVSCYFILDSSYLLKEGCDASVLDNDHNTPLFFICRWALQEQKFGT